ncbi:hypothetical protein QL285_068772 [Trifolium repens]|nr:hypothetical protein QL285_068772 [Trifolium repens]
MVRNAPDHCAIQNMSKNCINRCVLLNSKSDCQDGQFRISAEHPHSCGVLQRGNVNLFRLHVDVSLGDLKHQLIQLNGCVNHRDQRRVTDIEYRRPSVCSDGTVLFTSMKLQTDGDVRTMFSIFSQFMTKGPIEQDTRLVRSVEDKCSNLIRPRTFDEIAACMIQSGEGDEAEPVN